MLMILWKSTLVTQMTQKTSEAYVKPVSLPRSFSNDILIHLHPQAREIPANQVTWFNLAIFYLQFGFTRIKRSKK